MSGDSKKSFDKITQEQNTLRADMYKCLSYSKAGSPHMRLCLYCLSFYCNASSPVSYNAMQTPQKCISSRTSLHVLAHHGNLQRHQRL